jgi:phosphoribosylformylglycinamidine cyclo-ligase
VEALLMPTRIYVKPMLTLFEQLSVRGLAHITGGGLLENIPRVLPTSVSAAIDLSSWDTPDVFKWLQNTGNITQHEMLRTFNCGVGMTVFVPPEQAEQSIRMLNDAGENAWRIGEVRARTNNEALVLES